MKISVSVTNERRRNEQFASTKCGGFAHFASHRAEGFDAHDSPLASQPQIAASHIPLGVGDLRLKDLRVPFAKFLKNDPACGDLYRASPRHSLEKSHTDSALEIICWNSVLIGKIPNGSIPGYVVSDQ